MLLGDHGRNGLLPADIGADRVDQTPSQVTVHIRGGHRKVYPSGKMDIPLYQCCSLVVAELRINHGEMKDEGRKLKID